MTKFFKKSKTKLFVDHFGPFPPNLVDNEVSWKKGLCQFLNIPIIYHHAKNQKKKKSGDFIGPSVGIGCKN